MTEVLVEGVEIPALLGLGGSEHNSGAILKRFLTQMHLDEVQVFLQELGLLSCLVDDVDFVADNDDWDAEVYLEDAFSEGHVEAHIDLVCAHVRVQVVHIRTRFEFSVLLLYQVSIVINLGLFVRLNMALDLLFHLLVLADLHIWKHGEYTFLEGLQPRPKSLHDLHRIVKVKTDDSGCAFETVWGKHGLDELTALAILHTPNVELGEVVVIGDSGAAHL